MEKLVFGLTSRRVMGLKYTFKMSILEQLKDIIKREVCAERGTVTYKNKPGTYSFKAYGKRKMVWHYRN